MSHEAILKIRFSATIQRVCDFGEISRMFALVKQTYTDEKFAISSGLSDVERSEILKSITSEKQRKLINKKELDGGNPFEVDIETPSQ